MWIQFAPWRMEYILSDKKTDDCIFCKMVRGPEEEDSLVVHRTALSIVALNKYPYNNGHLMVAPKRHVKDLSGLSESELIDLFRTVRHCEKVLAETMTPEGFNVGINIGSCAGAGVLGHIHVHVVPRFSGDSNFMTTVSETRVIPELLDDTLRRLKPSFAAYGANYEGKT